LGGGGFLPSLNLNRQRAISKTSIVLKRGFFEPVRFLVARERALRRLRQQEPGLRQTLTRGKNVI
jgi:hypothetical protein